MKRETVFSEDRVYRYTLWREWGVGTLSIFAHQEKPSAYVQFIGLNPSTADETQDDPTVRRCIGFAKRWGFGAMCMTNAFAFRATDPKVMLAHPQPNDIAGKTTLHCPNDFWLKEISIGAGLVIAAWGKHGKHLNRDREIIALIPELHCLGTNGDGTPKHPLYLVRNTIPIQF